MDTATHWNRSLPTGELWRPVDDHLPIGVVLPQVFGQYVGRLHVVDGIAERRVQIRHSVSVRLAYRVENVLRLAEVLEADVVLGVPRLVRLPIMLLLLLGASQDEVGSDAELEEAFLLFLQVDGTEATGEARGRLVHLLEHAGLGGAQPPARLGGGEVRHALIVRLPTMHNLMRFNCWGIAF